MAVPGSKTTIIGPVASSGRRAARIANRHAGKPEDNHAKGETDCEPMSRPVHDQVAKAGARCSRIGQLIDGGEISRAPRDIHHTGS